MHMDFKARVSNLGTVAYRNLSAPPTHSKLQGLGPSFQIDFLKTDRGSSLQPSPAMNETAQLGGTTKLLGSLFIAFSGITSNFSWTSHFIAVLESGEERPGSR